MYELIGHRILGSRTKQVTTYLLKFLYLKNYIRYVIKTKTLSINTCKKISSKVWWT